MPLEQLPQGTDRDDYTPPPPQASEAEMARLATIEYLKLSGVAQLAEKKDPWKPAALGMWADAVADQDRTEDDHLIEAMRFVERYGYRPYCCTPEQDRWCWFDVSKKIEEMEDGPSDLAAWLFAILKGGKLEVNFRTYPTGISALEDVITSLAGWFESGRRLDSEDRPIPVKGEEQKPADEPEMQ